MKVAARRTGPARAKTLRAICIAICVIAVASPSLGAQRGGQAPWTVKTALKQIDKATKKLRAVRADVEYVGGAGPSAINGRGTMLINPDGAARFDLSGDEPRSAFWLYAYVLFHDPTMNTLTAFNLLTNPQVLPQYALLGFVPRGSGLKKDYQVNFTGEETLDGKQVLFFVLVPKSKEVARSVSIIRLWIDQATWLPAKQEVLLANSKAKLTVRYLTTEQVDPFPDAMFRPKVPPGTEKIEH